MDTNKDIGFYIGKPKIYHTELYKEGMSYCGGGFI